MTVNISFQLARPLIMKNVTFVQQS